MAYLEASIEIDAPPGQVWDLVADVTRMGEWSPICAGCEWLDGATGPASGAAFVGHNRQGLARWSRRCVITACEPGRRFAFSTSFKGREATRWSYAFEETPAGTLVTE